MRVESANFGADDPVRGPSIEPPMEFPAREISVAARLLVRFLMALYGIPGSQACFVWDQDVVELLMTSQPQLRWWYG